jgi:SAM-dependent methyltransferase
MKNEPSIDAQTTPKEDQAVRQQVRQFYDEVGWQVTGEGVYQNTRYEDLRPVSAEYIHKCHLRVNRHLAKQGKYLLDAGSGPVQYPEYRTYSEGYAYRVCADLSIVALQEARKRLGDHALCVVADVSRLPFSAEAFDGVVSLHTLHHLRADDQLQAYREVHRVLTGGRSAVLVNGWTHSPLMMAVRPLMVLLERLGMWVARRRGREAPGSGQKKKTTTDAATGTYIQKLDADWLRGELGDIMRFDFRVWRSVNVRFLRAFVFRPLAGQLWLRLLYAVEETWPHFFGEKGQYPMVIINKAQGEKTI